MLVICPIFDRVELLPFYLRYYERLGATQFVAAVWNGKQNPLCDLIERYATDYPIEIRTSIECPVNLYNGPAESNGLNKIVDEFRDRFPWYCLADLDEFCWFTGDRKLSQVAHEAEKKGYTAVHGTFFDRMARDYKLPSIRLLKDLDAVFPLVCDLTRVIGANYNKIPLSRSDLRVESGHHATSGNPWYNQAEVHHFKWTEGLIERLRERDLYFHQQGMLWAAESQKFLSTLEKGAYLEEPAYCTREARKLRI